MRPDAPAPTPADAVAGTLLGLACGDALGRPVEFLTADQIRDRYGHVTDLLGYGTHGQPAGTVTDDTDLALCIARSLVETGGFDPTDIADRFVAWFDAGPFDVGLMTADALGTIRRGTPPEQAGSDVHAARPEGSNAGNGSVMRCAPHALAFDDDPTGLVEVSRRSSAVTHADDRCTWGCAVLNLAIADLVAGGSTPLATALDRVGDDVPQELRDALEPIPDDVDPDDLTPSGYVIDTLRLALYQALTADSAEAAIVETVNRGGDADTTGAVAGAVAGARFGASSLPSRWLDEISAVPELERLAGELHTGDFGPDSGHATDTADRS